jgi:hypothetical protein
MDMAKVRSAIATRVLNKAVDMELPKGARSVDAKDLRSILVSVDGKQVGVPAAVVSRYMDSVGAERVLERSRCVAWIMRVDCLQTIMLHRLRQPRASVWDGVVFD